VRFLFDASVPACLVQAMEIVEKGAPHPHDIIPHGTWFPEGTRDPEWLRALTGEPNLILVTADVEISRARKPERIAWEQSGITAFFLGGQFAGAQRWKQLHRLAYWWPGITRTARSAPSGSGWLTHPSKADPEQLYPSSRRS
jgi:hypothetical protein